MQSINSYEQKRTDAIDLIFRSAPAHRARAVERELTHLHFHWVGVHLAHVLATVLHSDVPYDQRPCVVIVVCNGQPIAVRNYVLVYRQNGFCVCFYPRNLNHFIFRTRVCVCVCECVFGGDLYVGVCVRAVQWMNGKCMFWKRIPVCKRKNALEKNKNEMLAHGNFGVAWMIRAACWMHSHLWKTFFWVLQHVRNGERNEEIEL